MTTTAAAARRPDADDLRVTARDVGDELSWVIGYFVLICAHAIAAVPSARETSALSAGGSEPELLPGSKRAA